MPISKRRLVKIEAIRDEDIDTSDIAELDEVFFRNARLVMPAMATKKSATLRMDDDVLAWFRSEGSGHLTRMNAVLRAYMMAHQGKDGQSSN